jgi:hypothetical protein
MWEDAETGALFVLVQQFSHLLDRERRVVGAQCLLALASSEKWAIQEHPHVAERAEGSAAL